MTTQDLLTRLLELTELRKESEREERVLKAMLKDVLKTQGLTTLEESGVRAVLSYQNRTSLDKEALRAKLGLDFSRYEVSQEVETLTVSRISGQHKEQVS